MRTKNKLCKSIAKHEFDMDAATVSKRIAFHKIRPYSGLGDEARDHMREVQGFNKIPQIAKETA